MPATRIEFNTGGLFYGWSHDEVEAIDKDATENRLIEILREVAPTAEIVIRWEDGNDKIEGEWLHANERSDLLREIADLPWHDGQWWSVPKA